jgi:hypothetical protein
MTNDASSASRHGRPDDASITWDHPSRLIAHFVVESRSTREELRAILGDAATHGRYWSARGTKSLGDPGSTAMWGWQASI